MKKVMPVFILSILFSVFQVMALDCELRCDLGSYQVKKDSSNAKMPCHSSFDGAPDNANTKNDPMSACGQACDSLVYEHSTYIDFGLKNVDNKQDKLLDFAIKSLSGTNLSRADLRFALNISNGSSRTQRPLYILYEKYIL